MQDTFFEQMTNISKAHAYDIVSDQVKELQEKNERLKEINMALAEALGKVQKVSGPLRDVAITLSRGNFKHSDLPSAYSYIQNIAEQLYNIPSEATKKATI